MPCFRTTAAAGRFPAVSAAPPTQPLRRTGVALIGGFRTGGRVRVGDRMVRVSAIGGMDLDLTEATFEAPRLTVVKVSLIGGLKLRVPAGARVEVHGFAIGGRTVESGPAGRGPGEADAQAPTIVVHAWGVIGGVKVRRAA
jgi:hypothetical protein